MKFKCYSHQRKYRSFPETHQLTTLLLTVLPKLSPEGTGLGLSVPLGTCHSGFHSATWLSICKPLAAKTLSPFFHLTRPSVPCQAAQTPPPPHGLPCLSLYLQLQNHQSCPSTASFITHSPTCSAASNKAPVPARAQY